MAEEETSKLRRLAGCEGTPGQGPFMAIVLDVVDDKVVNAHFQTYGCPASQACGQFACEWAIGKAIDQISELDAAGILQGVGAMPLGREHCPPMTVAALRRCIAEL
jgi:NifU-like protein involved in Fe-S cluster formation